MNGKRKIDEKLPTPETFFPRLDITPATIYVKAVIPAKAGI
ncbi:MAG: hypothetical protein ABFD82_23475 [Syntrophaceae bacterium]